MSAVSQGGPAVGEAMVGLFWRVPGHPTGFRIISHRRPLSAALHYGSYLTVGISHYKFWQRLQRRPRSWLTNAGISASASNTEYEEWPRGRVAHSKETGRSKIMLDVRLFPPRAIEAVALRFCLQAGSYDVVCDTHYRALALTKPPALDEH